MAAEAVPRSPASRARRLAAGAVLAVLAGGAAFACWRALLPAPAPAPLPDDPRLRYDGPYRNVRPDVPYVGDGDCALCHRDVSDSFRRHPMGNSLVPIAGV